MKRHTKHLVGQVSGLPSTLLGRPISMLKTCSTRGGLVLIIVLIVVAVMTLAAYTFSELMLTEHKAARVVGKQVQSRVLVESGAAMLQTFLYQTPDQLLQSGGVYNNPAQFQGVLISDDGTPAGRGRISVLAASVENGTVTNVRPGLENESAKLNINALAQWEKQVPGIGTKLLSALPGMTPDVSDSILDWITSGDTARENGAKSDYYGALSPPYACKSGPADTVEELLKVKGMTPLLLFGDDTNRNWLVDNNEQGRSQLAEGAGADQEWDRGWGAYLTVYSRETNLQADGTLKIDLNMDDLETLATELDEAGVRQEWINFIIAYRQFGGSQPTTTTGSGSGNSGSGGSGTNQNQGGSGQQGQPTGRYRPSSGAFYFVALQGGGGFGNGAPGGGGGGRAGGGGVPGGGGGGGGRAGGGGGFGQGGGPGGGGPGGGGRGGAGGPGGGGGGRAGGGGGRGGPGGGGGGRGGPGGGGRGGPGGGQFGGGRPGAGGGGRQGGGVGRQQGIAGGGGQGGAANQTPVSAALVDIDPSAMTGSHKLQSVLDLVGVQIQFTGYKNSSGGSGASGGTGQTGTGTGIGSGTGTGTGTGTGQTGTGTTGQGGQNQTTIIAEAFPDIAETEQDYLPELLDHVTVGSAGSFAGRININQAPRALILAVMDGVAQVPNASDVVDQIMSLREAEFSGQNPDQKYETWLYTQGLVKLDEMKKLVPFFTTGGSVYRAQIVGYFDDGGTASRVEAIIDTSPIMVASDSTTSATGSSQGTSGAGPSNTGGGLDSSSTSSSSTTSSSSDSTAMQPMSTMPRIVFWRDMSHLPVGFTRDVLGSGSN